MKENIMITQEQAKQLTIAKLNEDLREVFEGIKRDASKGKVGGHYLVDDNINRIHVSYLRELGYSATLDEITLKILWA